MHYLEKELTNKYGFDSTVVKLLSQKVFSGIWFWDLENPEEEFFDDTFWLTLGYDPNEMPNKSNAWQSLVHPEDVKLAYQLVEKHLADPAQPYKQIMRYTHKEGHTIYIHCTGHAIVKEGKPVRLLGVHVEITAEHRRLKNLENFFSQNSDLAILVNSSGLIQEANIKALDSLNITSSELGTLGLQEALGRKGFALAAIQEVINEPALIKGPQGLMRTKFSLIPSADNFLFIAHDYTSEAILQAKLERLNELNKGLIEVSEEFLGKFLEENDFWELVLRGLKIFAPFLKANEISIFSYENIGNDLVEQLYRISFSADKKTIINDTIREYPASFFQAWLEVHEQKECLLVEKSAPAPAEEIQVFLQNADTATYLAVPLFNQDTLMGFISMSWSEELEYSQELKPISSLFAKILNDYWQQVSIHSKAILQKKLTHSILESISTPVAIVDRKTFFISYNKELSRILFGESSASSRIQADLIDFLDGENSNIALNALNSMGDAKNKAVEIELQTSSGIAAFELVISSLQDGETPNKNYLLEFRSLAKINNLKEKRKEVDNLSKFIINESPLFLLRFCEKHQRINLTNEKTERLLEENEWFGKFENPNHPFHPKKAQEKNKLPYIETALKYKNQNIDIAWDLLKQRQENGDEVVWAFGRNNTVLRQSQKEIERKTRELEKTQSLALIGSYYYNMLEEKFEWSDETFRIFEINPESVETAPNHFDFVVEEDQAKVNGILESARNGDMEFYSTHRIETAKNRIKHLEDRCEIEFNQLGEAIAYRGVVKDISAERARQFELKQINKELSEANHLLQVLEKVTKALEEKNKLSKKNDKLLKLLGLLPGVEQISLISQTYLREAQNYNLNIEKAYNFDANGKSSTFSFSRSNHPSSEAFHKLLKDNGSEFSYGFLKPETFKSRFSLAKELKWSRNDIIYSIGKQDETNKKHFYCVKLRPDAFWDDSTQAKIDEISYKIKLLSSQALQIKNIKESENRFRLINRVSQSVIWEHDLETDQVTRGTGFETLIGSAGNEDTSLHVFNELVHPEDRKSIKSSSEKLRSGKVEMLRLNYRLKGPRDRYLLIEDMAIAIKNQAGEVYKLVGSMIDRTKEREQLSLIETATDLAKLAPLDLDLSKGELNNTSLSLAKIFDLELKDLNLKNSKSQYFYEPENTWLNGNDFFKKNLNNSEDREQLEIRIITHQQNEKWLRVRYKLEGEKKQRLTGVVQDITEEKQLNLDLKNSLFWLEKTQDIGNIGHWRVNIETGIWEVSGKIKESWELPEDLEYSAYNWLNLIKPEYRPTVEQAFQEALEGNGRYRVTYEIMIGFDPKNTAWIEADGEIIEADGIKYLAGYARNITETTFLNKKLKAHQESIKEISWKQSHLARGPLTRLISQSTEVLENSELKPEIKELLSSILLSAREVDSTLKESNALAETIDSLNDFEPEVFETKYLKPEDYTDKEVHICIVDDDPIICTLHQQILSRADFNCKISTLSSGEKLLERLEFHEDRLNLILLDINMPGMNGIEVLEKLNKSEAAKNSLVIMVSSSISTNDKVACASYPFVIDYFEKPLQNVHLEKLRTMPFCKQN